MKILYITTALDEGDYARLLAKGRRLNNPSNQNFHSRLISILKNIATIDIIRIISTPIDEKELANKNGELLLPYIEGRFKKLIHKDEVPSSFCLAPDIVIYDSLSVRAYRIAKNYAGKAALVPIITDNPNNLAKPSFFLQKAFVSSLDLANGFITVNPGILDSYGISKKTYSSIGFIDEKKERPSLYDKPYFYFGGALLDRYGINKLIKAFADSKADYDLLIAGHHEEEFNADDGRIHYLGQISKEDNLSYIAHASLLINPRPYEEKLDKESTPSKLLEYLSSGNPILSTPSSLIRHEFPNDVNWIEGKDVEREIKEFLAAHLDKDGKLLGIKENRAPERLYHKYGNEAQEAKLGSFLQEVISSSNKSKTF